MSYDETCGLCGVLRDEHARASCPEFVSGAPDRCHNCESVERERDAVAALLNERNIDHQRLLLAHAEVCAEREGSDAVIAGLRADVEQGSPPRYAAILFAVSKEIRRDGSEESRRRNEIVEHIYKNVCAAMKRTAKDPQ